MSKNMDNNLDIHSQWAHSLHQSALKHFSNTEHRKRTKSVLNPKFKNGMIYRFDVKHRVSVPIETMRMNGAESYGLSVMDEFEDDNVEQRICSGYTPRPIIDAVGRALEKVVEKKSNRKKRRFTEFKEDNQDN